MGKLREKRKNEQGFTLVEILVALAVLVILTAIAVPLFLNQRTKATEAGLKTEVETAAVQWQRDYYDSMRVWNPAFVTSLNMSASTVVLTGHVVGDKACVQGESSKMEGKYYSFVLNTEKGSKTTCDSHPDM